MKNKNIINPMGLKGKQISNRMLDLMNINEGVEENKNSVVELTKRGPDGNAYAIVRENHEYYIKIADKTEGLVFEDFKYIGGLKNKKSEVYESYAKATKQMNMKFKSLNEAYGISDNINALLDDNLLEHHGMNPEAKLSATKGVGDADEYVVDKKGDTLDYDASEDTETSGDNVATKKVDAEFETVSMSENEIAIDAILGGDVEEPIKETKKGFSIERAMNEMDDIVESIHGSDKVDTILEGLSESEKEAIYNALKKSVTESSNKLDEMKHDGMSTGLFSDEEEGYTLEEEESLEEDTKYKLKLPNPSPEPSGDDLDFGGEEDLDLDLGDEDEMDLGGEPSDDKPFDDEPFDADVEASEEDDPEKYIQQLSGKLGQSMRKHTEDIGQPDFDLEKFAINSVVSASHSAEMDEEDQDDIIKKVKSSGRGEAEEDMGDEMDVDADLDVDVDADVEDLGDKGGSDELDLGDEEGLEEVAPMGGEDMTRDQEHARDQYVHSDFDDEAISNCCSAPFVMGDICSDCGEHAVPAEPEASIEEDVISNNGTEHWALFGNIGSQIYKIDNIEDLMETFKYLYSKLENEKALDALVYFVNAKKAELERVGVVKPELNLSENVSIFVKNILREMTAPITKPKKKEIEVEPTPTRKTKTFNPVKKPNPNPKLGDGQELITGDEEE